MTGLPPELYAAVAAFPEDDAPRLACADWLDEHDRPDDAEFVRVQLRLARRKTERLASREVSRLNARQDELLRERGPAWAAVFGSVAELEWSRGFVTLLRANGPTAEALMALEALSQVPVAETLVSVSDPGLPPQAVSRLAVLPRLSRLMLGLDADGVGEPELEALAAQPRLTDLLIWRGPEVTYNDLLGAAGRARLAELRAARATPERGAEALPAHFVVRRTRAGALTVRASLYETTAAGEMEAAGVGGLTSLEMGVPDSTGWLSTLSELRGLQFPLPPGDFDARPLASLRQLRFVCISSGPGDLAAWRFVPDWLAGLPELTAVLISSNRGPVESLSRLTRLPNLRSLWVSPELCPLPDPPPENLVWGERGRAETGEPPLGPPAGVGGVSIRVPAWFRRLPDAPPAAVGGVETLATWIEWGDGDPLDRVPWVGPTWLTLERVPGTVRLADAGRLLTGPPGTLADAEAWSGVRPWTVGGAKGRYVEGRCPFARHLRVLWPGRGSALRLRAEWPHRRDSAGVVARAVAATVSA